MSYMIYNLTKRTIVLSDIRAEIGPHKTLDLEKVADRNSIDRSHRSGDLKYALKSSRVRLCSYKVAPREPEIPDVQIIERIVEKQGESLDEDKLKAMLREIVNEGRFPDSSQQLLRAFALLEQKIGDIGSGVVAEKSGNIEEFTIDPVRLAELHAKAVNKLDIETGIKKQGKKVVLKNTGLDQLADELA